MSRADPTRAAHPPAVADPARLSVLRESGLLDAAAEEAFDRLTRLAAKLIRVPATFISLVDEERDFYLSCVGFPDSLAAERQIDGPTFCHLAIQSDGPLVIPDTRADPGYAHIPTIESLGVSAYLGVPIRGVEGLVLGSFCAVDFKTREWTATEVETVVELARSAEREIELRRRIRQVEEQSQELEAQAAEMEAQIEKAQVTAEELEWTNTELCAARERAEADRAQLREVFEQAPVAVAVLRGPDHLFESANPEYRQMVGGRDVVGQTLAAALPEVVGQGFIALLDEVLRSGDPFVAHAIPVDLRADGDGEPRRRLIDLVYHPLRDADQAVTGIMVMATDVTERELAGATREHERERLAQVVAQFPGAVAVLEGPEHRFLAASELYRYGSGGRELVGRTYRDAFPEVAGQGYFELLDEVYRTGEQWAGIGVRASWDDNGDGVADEHRIDLVYAPLRDSAGTVNGIAVVYSVVDERERSAEALRASDERYQLASRATADVIWDWDLGADVIRWNAALGQRFGHTPERGETSGSWWLDQIHPEEREAVAHSLHSALDRGAESWSAEYRFLRADGTYANVLDRGHIGQHSGGVRRMVGAMQDVTEQRRAEQLRLALYDEARRARAEADHANLAKSQFLAQMSHEIRTPINAVVGYVDLLEAGIAGELNAQQAEYVARVRASGRHLLGLVSDILDLSKAEAGEMEVACEPTPLLGTAAAALGMVAPLAQARGIELLDASTAAGDVLYLGDEDRVRQVAVNLLSNAVRFTGDGGRVTVRCRVAQEGPVEGVLEGPGPWLALEVEDTGQGIPADELERIFDPFAQVDGGHTRRTGGTGLGLTISRRFARLMGGDLTVRSTLGQGSCFVLWLPTPEGARAPDAPPEEPTTVQSATEHWFSGSHGIPGLAEVGRLLARNADAFTERFGERLRGDPGVPGAGGLNQAQLEDHIATFLLDTGRSLVAMDGGRGDPELMQDGTAIQRVISERHGEQRRRLGWTAEHMRREFALLREELEALVARESEGRPPAELAGALSVVHRLLARAEQRGLRAFGGAPRGEAANPGG